MSFTYHHPVAGQCCAIWPVLLSNFWRCPGSLSETGHPLFIAHKWNEQRIFIIFAHSTLVPVIICTQTSCDCEQCFCLLNSWCYQVKFQLAKPGFMKQFEGSWKVQPLYVDSDGGPAPEDNANRVASIVSLQQVCSFGVTQLKPPYPSNQIQHPNGPEWFWSTSLNESISMML